MSRNPFAPVDGDDCEEPAERQVVAIELAENQAAGPQNHVTNLVAETFGRALEAMSDRREQDGKAPLSPGLQDGAVHATKTVLGAVEGTLNAKSLEGALKQAQIEREYAEAALARAQAKQLDVDTAWTQLNNTLELFAKLGLQVQLITLPDGRPGITVGDGLAQMALPGMASATEETAAGELAPPSK